MTKENVVVPEERADTVVTTAPPENSQKNFSQCLKKLSKLELIDNGNPWMNSYVDSMKSSSPTSTLTTNFDTEYENWLKEHPSALANFDEISASLTEKKVVMFLDYDGTLSPIVEDPDKAFMSEEMRMTVKDLARHFPTAIVSGRGREMVQSFVKLAGLCYAGSHGMDIELPNIRFSDRVKTGLYSNAKPGLFQPAIEYLPMINKVYKELVEATKPILGARVENNNFCLSVHYRCVDEKKWSSVAEKVATVIKNYPELHVTQGRKVFEIRPSIKWDKGKALEYLMEFLGLSECNELLPIYIGDDRTDEDAFKVLREKGMGFGIVVSKHAKETNASYSLREPEEVMQFLRELVVWKDLARV